MTSVLAGRTSTFRTTLDGIVVADAQWSASGGSITSQGVFTAPAQTGTYRIQASYGEMTAVATASVVGPGTPEALYLAASSTCADMPLRSTGTIHYFCDCKAGAESGCLAGDDANDGLRPATAKRRWYAALQAFSSMNAGDTIALCKGGAWNLDTATGTCGSSDPGVAHDTGSAYVANPRCTAGSTSLTDSANTGTCDIRDYQASWGGSRRPLVAIGNAGSTEILGRSAGTTTGVRIMNLEFRGGNAGPRAGTYNAHTGIYQGSCGPVTDFDWLVCNNDFNHLALGMHIEENSSRFTSLKVWGNRFTMNDLDAILGGPGTNGSIDANYFDNNGGFGRPVGGPAHTIYPNAPGGVTGAQIINNQIYYSAVPCANAIISGHGSWNGLNVENNLIDCGSTPAGCWAMKLDSGNRSGAGPHYQRGAHVHRNFIRAGSVGIGLGQVSDTIVENNVIVATGGSTDWFRGILLPSEGSFGFDVSNRNTIRNNTIYIPLNESNAAGLELGSTSETETGHVIANNSVYAGGSVVRCFMTTSGASAYAFVGNNACFQGTWGTAFDDTTHVTANPLFANAPADFTPRPTSPLVGAGNPAHAPSLDRSPKPRPDPPSIGAYEP